MQREKIDKQVSLSIVVPIYNQEPYLIRCVDSLLALELDPADYELILVNDGSIDGSGEICNKYAAREGERIHYVTSPNRGVSAARNFGVREATGEYVAFVDGDDWVEPWMFTQMLALMKERPEMELSVCGIRYEYQGKIRYRDPSLPSDRLLVPSTAFAFMMEGRYLRHYPFAKIYKKALLEKCPFPEDMKLGEDLIFHLLLFEHLSGPVGYFRSEGYHYDMRFDNASQGKQFSQEFLDRAYLETRRIYEAIEGSNSSWRQFEIAKFCYRALYKRLLRLFLIDDPQEKYAERIKEYQQWCRSILERFSLLETYETARAQKQELHFLLMPYEEARGHYHAFVANLQNTLKEIRANFHHVYFFGMGIQGLCLAIICQTKQVECEGIISNDVSLGFWEGHYLRTVESIAPSDDTAFILASSDGANKKMYERLIELGHRHIFDSQGKCMPGSEAVANDFGGAKLLTHGEKFTPLHGEHMICRIRNCRRVFWGTKESECAYPVRQLASMVRDGDIFVEEDVAFQGRLFLGCPVCRPETLKELVDGFVIVVLLKDYGRIRDWLIKRGYVEEVNFFEGVHFFNYWKRSGDNLSQVVAESQTCHTLVSSSKQDEKYDATALLTKYIGVSEIDAFCESVPDNKKLVMVEWGTSEQYVYDKLKKQGKHICAVAARNKKLVNISLELLTYEEAVAAYPDAVYIIPTKARCYDKQAALMDLGLGAGNFCLRGEAFISKYRNRLPKDYYAAVVAAQHYGITKVYPNLKKPQTFNEKIMAEMIKDDGCEIKSRLTDKYAVRSWIKEKIGEQYLMPLLGVWSSVEEIDFDKLPEKYVLKTNNGCGYNIIIDGEHKIQKNLAIAKLSDWLGTNFAGFSFERQYAQIKPLIICEEYFENKDGDVFDYKVFCFNGVPKYIMYLCERKQGLKMAIFDTNWNKQEFVYSFPRYEEAVPKPECLDKMLEVSSKLSCGFSQVRVDWYVLNDGALKFGEMTFTSCAAHAEWTPAIWDKKLGLLIPPPCTIIALW